jgi:hypothetical protein
MRVGVGALKVGTRPAASSSFTNERTVAEKIHPVQILFWVPLPGGCLGGISPDLSPQKIYPLPPLLIFAHRLCITQCMWLGSPLVEIWGMGVLSARNSFS